MQLLKFHLELILALSLSSLKKADYYYFFLYELFYVLRTLYIMHIDVQESISRVAKPTNHKHLKTK